MSKNLIGICIVAFIHQAIACTSFGYITNTGTVIAKNSDFYYDKQSIDVLAPNKQFMLWYDNKYNNNFRVFAQIANNNVKMGVNEYGLVAMEEDPPLTKYSKNRRSIQPLDGTAECMTLWGILQNFKTVDQLMPYLKDIFSHASPNYYEIADNKKILVVEVAFGNNDSSTTRDFSYKVLDKDHEFYTHTNTYQDRKFINLNQLADNPLVLRGSDARNNRIKELLTTKERTESNTLLWLLDTQSTSYTSNDNNLCLATSIFNSYVGKIGQIDTSKVHSDFIGTVASMAVFDNGSPEKTKIVVRMVDKITNDSQGNQTIFYKELQSSLPDLFNQNYNFHEKEFKRLRPTNGICK